MERPGVIDLRDASHRYMWHQRSIEAFVAPAALDVEERWSRRDFFAPRVVVAIAPFDQPEILDGFRTWLATAEHVIVVLDLHGEPIDAELVDGLRTQWTTTLAGLPAEAIDWTDDAAPGIAIERALARCEELPPRASRSVPDNPDLDLPMSRWVPLAGWRYRMQSLLGSSLAWQDGRPVIVDAHGATVDLSPLCQPVSIDHTDLMRGRARLCGDRYRHLVHVGIDPVHPVAWRGARMAAYWWLVTDDQIGFLSATDHDWPTGPAKKLWGHEDNDPVAVALAPDASAAALQFMHDVTLIDNVPICWHRAGAVDVAAFKRSSRRAAFYANETEWIAAHDPLDDDVREFSPAFVLGPECYALGLTHRTMRVSGPHEVAEAIHVGGPGEGYAVFDFDHQHVRRGTGTLLGGWYRHATVEDAGSLWREDIVTGRREHLGLAARVLADDTAVDAVLHDAIREGRADVLAQLATRTIDDERQVLAIPGTRNVLEFTEHLIRVI